MLNFTINYFRMCLESDFNEKLETLNFNFQVGFASTGEKVHIVACFVAITNLLIKFLH